MRTRKARRARLLLAALLGAALSACAPAASATRPAGPTAEPVPVAASKSGSATGSPAALSTTAPSASQTGVQPMGATVPAAPAVVVLDPGHNGGNANHPGEIERLVPDGRGGAKACNSTGTATNAGYAEHAFTFDVAKRVEAKLVAAGIRVVLTRPDDSGVGPCVDERGQAGERANAAAVVSIHADGTDAGDSGFHVALSDPPLGAAQQGPAHALGTALRDAMRKAGFHDATYTGRDGIAPRPDLAGLNLATRPTALVECANMRNDAEARVVSSPEGRERYAIAITAGVLAFLGRP